MGSTKAAEHTEGRAAGDPQKKQAGKGGGTKSRHKKGGEEENENGRKKISNQAGRGENQERKEKTGGGAHSAKAKDTRGRRPEKARDSGGAETGRKKNYKGKKEDKQKDNNGATPARRGPSGAEGQSGHKQGEAHQNAPERLVRPAQPRRARTHRHTQAQDPGGPSSDAKGEVSASTRKRPGAPAESPVQRRAVWETGCVSDLTRTRKPRQRTQRNGDGRGTHQGQPPRGARNGYDAERAQRWCLGGGQRQGPSARFSASLHVPRSVNPGKRPPWVAERRNSVGEADRSNESGRTTRGHEVRQRGKPPATTKAD